MDTFSAWLGSNVRRPLVMGVLNVTPDSFSDGDRYFAADAAVEHAAQITAAGADLIDIGAESTRPGAARVPADEQLRRLRPVLDRLSRQQLPVILSIDTTQAEVAQLAIDAGAQLVNDISAGRDDAGMFALVARAGVAMVLMHMQGQPATMQVNPVYRNVLDEVRQFLQQRLAEARQAGIAPQRLLIDPGIGFGKSAEHNLTLLKHVAELKDLGRPIVAGTSRKGFIGRISGEEAADGRIMGTAASVSWCVANGVDIVRVHDVEPMAKVVRVARAIHDAS